MNILYNALCFIGGLTVTLILLVSAGWLSAKVIARAEIRRKIRTGALTLGRTN